MATNTRLSQATPTPTPKAELAALPVHRHDATRLLDASQYICLDYNESPYGAAPTVLHLLQRQSHLLAHRYPDPGCARLRTALAAAYRSHSEQIACGNGSDELIALIARTYAGPGDEIIFSQYGFYSFASATRAAGAIAREVQADPHTLGADVDAILASITPRTKIVFIANPNNPTGTILGPDEIGKLHRGLPSSVLLVLDAAYADYVPDNIAYDAGDSLIAAGNVVVLRTFSKAYGLAGLRLGWAHGSEAICSVLNSARRAFNTSHLAQTAALCALEDEAFVTEVITKTSLAHKQFCQQLDTLQLPYHTGATGYVLVDFATSDKAEQVRTTLRDKHHILVRDVAGYGLGRYLRIGIGTDAQMRLTAEALFSLR
jgi:histidinol-phosphate aminotransferase